MEVRRGSLISAPAHQVWELVGDATLFARTAGPEHLWTFVVPGTPAGFVGERRVTLTRVRDDQVAATLVERIDMVHGRQVATRNLINGMELTTVVEERGPSSCQLTYVLRTAPADESLAAASLDARLARVSAYVAGEPPPSGRPEVPLPDPVDVQMGQVVVVGTVSAPPAEVWATVRTAGGALAELARPEAATVVTVPGTPAGEVGERICIVAFDPPFVQVLEVVAQDVGRSVTVRYLTAPTTAARTVALMPSALGTQVAITIDFVAPGAELADHERRMRRVAETFLRCYQS
ncbi:hypothetical protein ASF78_10975 [Cellulomonas sp. Leaf334]|nr:hypothetical protein ASF78_10975 [Cellulomonas sp. Leaf334]